MDWVLDHGSAVPLHVQAERLLRRMAASAVYQRGRLLPDEIGLARKLGVSRGTLRLAIDRLVREGLFERRRGVGTRVARAPVASGLQSWLSFSGEMRARGIEVEDFGTTARMVKVPAAWADWMEVSRAKKVLELVRVRGWHGEPVVRFQSFLHPRTEVAESSDWTRPLYDLIEEASSLVADRSRDELRAEAANASLARSLRIKHQDPVLVRTRQVFERGGRLLEVAICHFRGDRFHYTVDLAGGVRR